MSAQENGNGAAAAVKESRGTVSHTPEAGSDTVVLVAVTAHDSIAIPEKVEIAVRDAMYAAAAATIAKLMPKLSVLTRQGTEAGKVSDKDRAWTRMRIDTPETVKIAKPKTAGKSKLEKLLAATFDAGKLLTDVRAEIAKGTDPQVALAKVGHAMGLKDEQLYDFGLARKVEAAAKVADKKTAKK